MSAGFIRQLAALLTITIGLGLAGAAPVVAQKFYPDDPLLIDHDDLDTPTMPTEIELSDLYDRFGHIFSDVGNTPIGGEAENVNTLDEVPDCSWFVNRHGIERLSIADLVRGPNRGNTPDPDQQWAVFKSKSQGLTPGFQIKDERGDRYVIKLDPVGVPELSSAAEVIATKIFYALGYHVPENYVVRIDPANFTIAPGTMFTDPFGDRTPLTKATLEQLLRRVPPLPDGRLRITASKYFPGIPRGPFRYFNTRSDDPNDVILHEQRRELRGLRLLAAWVNHDDTRAQNTQGVWVEVDDKHYLRHYLMDFGSTFGSGSVDLQLPNLSFHYWMDLGLMRKNLLGLGLHVPKYRKVKWPRFPEYASVGRWEGDAFDPEEWKNDYPNPAFVRMTARDAFWAAKILMRFTPEELAAIVGTGEFSDPQQESYFLEVLLQRQQKCGRFGINGTNPLAGFAVVDDALTFTNLSEQYGFGGSGTTYDIGWLSYNNADDTLQPLSRSAAVRTTSVALPPTDGFTGQQDLYPVAEIRSQHPDFPHWNHWIRVYLRQGATGFEVVGIEREP